MSERNCIEILMKLKSMKLLDILHSCDGKEYLTPDHLVVEIHEEIEAHGGSNCVVIIFGFNEQFTNFFAFCYLSFEATALKVVNYKKTRVYF